jgi:hypothetical protein
LFLFLTVNWIPFKYISSRRDWSVNIRGFDLHAKSQHRKFILAKFADNARLKMIYMYMHVDILFNFTKWEV